MNDNESNRLVANTQTKNILPTNKNISYYFAAVGLFILLKFGFTIADNNDLTFLLEPTNRFVGFLTGSQSVYFPDRGYLFEQLHIVIDKSCSGFNFWTLCFLLFTYLGIKHFDKAIHKILMIPAGLIGAYLLTLFVNTSRIFASIVIQKQANQLLPARPHLILHEIVGIVTNLTFLVLAYLLINKLLLHIRNHEKFV